MALTNEEKQELLNAMQAESQGVDELEQVDSLDGIVSLPALRGEEVVSAPIKLLTKPAENAVASAGRAAKQATEAAQTVHSVTQSANSAARAANAAASEASDAADKANSAVSAASEVVAKYENVAKAERAVGDRTATKKAAQKEAAKQRAKDADDDVKEDALLRILTELKNAPVRQYEELLRMDNVELIFTEEALRAVAKKAIKRKTGARSLKGIIEDIMLDVMFDIPRSDASRKVTITEKCITDGEQPAIEPN